jgi:hypothetical protein
MKIRNFNEAKHRLQELSDSIKDLREFLDAADSAISAVNTLKGGSEPASDPLANNGSAPAAWTDRVWQLYRESGQPMMPKAALNAYVAKGWEKPDDPRDFYLKISSAVAYLTKRKGVLIKTPEGYAIKK